MARDHARVYLSIWDDDEFRALSPSAQHLYFLLMTAPEMNYAGVTDWRPNRIAKKASAWTPYAVEVAAQELSERLYIVIDVDTEEVLLRSLIRHDGLLEQPNLAVAVRKAWAAVASPNLRGVVIHELNRLRNDKPDLKGWGNIVTLLDKPSIDPSGNPSFHPSDDPSRKGSDDPSRKGSDDPSVGPTPNPSDDPSVKGSPITAPSSLLLTPAPSSNRTEDQDLGGDRNETLAAADATKPASKAEPNCSKHPSGNPTNEPCAGCAKVREHRDRLEERDRERRVVELEQAKLGCPDCEGTGKVLAGEDRSPTRRTCNHPKVRRSA